MRTRFLDWSKSEVRGFVPVRADRRPKRFPVEACGFDRCGHFFIERTETSDVSESGCRFRLRTELARDAILAIRVLNDCHGGARPSPAVLFRMVRMERNEEAWNIAASKLQQDDPWTDGLIEAEN
jgi:hypothetical protein